MRQMTMMLFIAAACFGCASAVDEPYFSCDNDDDCPSGKKCVSLEYSDKVCRSASCTDNGDCESGQYCDDKTKQCREYCENDWDCNLTESCNEATGRCTEMDTD